MLDILLSVIAFWFPNSNFQEFWFSHDYDDKIRIKYLNIHNKIITSNIDDLIKYILDYKDPKILLLSIVIIIDQFTRNLFRNVERIFYKKTDNMCIRLIKKCNISFNSYPIHQRIFMLLPFRHQRTTPYLDMVMNEISIMKQDSNSTNDMNIISRFEKATLKDYTKVVDTIEILHTNNKCFHHLSKENISKDKLKLKILEYLDDKCIKYSLDRLHIKLDVKDNSLYKTINTFLTKHNIKRPSISLSGGVDSMVISYILVCMRANNVIDEFCATHIDYANRDISLQEANFVKIWCNYFNITLYTRRITHMKRNGSNIRVDRGLYESETKEIRFNVYRKSIVDSKVQCVILGHHRGDLEENVLMNVLKGGDILNLFTMKDYQQIDDVIVCRPLLTYSKDDIFKFADNYEVPYLKDTTSENCMRGVLRKVVIPSIKKIDSSISKKLISVGKSSDLWNNHIEKDIKKLSDGVITHKYGFILPTNNIGSNLKYSSKLLCKIFHKQKLNMISNKNMVYFMKNINNNKFLKLSNNHNVIKFYNTLVFIRTDLVTRHKINNILSLEITDDFNTMYNGWKIKIDNYNSEHKNIINDVKLSNFLDGSFSYIYHTCQHSKPSYKDDNHIKCNIIYSMGNKYSINKKLFKSNIIFTYLPKVHLGIPCRKCVKDNITIKKVITFDY
jgi:tRNA(Ile)-lysidine synthetase-like protein